MSCDATAEENIARFQAKLSWEGKVVHAQKTKVKANACIFVNMEDEQVASKTIKKSINIVCDS
jgi:hypothetical protein